MRAKLYALRDLKPADRLFLLKAWLLLPLFDLSLALFPFRSIQRFNAKNLKQPMADDPPITALHAWALLVEIAAQNHIRPMTCLRRSLTLQWLLARQGILTELRIGVRKEADEFQAHAWLTFKGTTIGESEVGDLRYVPFADSSSFRWRD